MGEQEIILRLTGFIAVLTIGEMMQLLQRDPDLLATAIRRGKSAHRADIAMARKPKR